MAAEEVVARRALRFILSLAFFLFAKVGSGLVVLLTVLVLDFVILVVPWHFLRADPAKRVVIDLPVLFAADRDSGIGKDSG
jgi:hypothetical protein